MLRREQLWSSFWNQSQNGFRENLKTGLYYDIGSKRVGGKTKTKLLRWRNYCFKGVVNSKSKLVVTDCISFKSNNWGLYISSDLNSLTLYMTIYFYWKQVPKPKIGRPYVSKMVWHLYVMLCLMSLEISFYPYQQVWG